MITIFEIRLSKFLGFCLDTCEEATETKLIYADPNVLYEEEAILPLYDYYNMLVSPDDFCTFIGSLEGLIDFW